MASRSAVEFFCFFGFSDSDSRFQTPDPPLDPDLFLDLDLDLPLVRSLMNSMSSPLSMISSKMSNLCAFIKHFELDLDPDMDSDGVWIPGLLDAILVLDLDPQKTSLVWRAQYR